MIVTEIVKGIETRDAKETATGTVTATKTEIGTVTDGTLACHSLVIIPSVIADNYSCFFVTVRSRRGGGGDHWEPEDRERRSDVRFPGPNFTLILSHVHSLSLASTAFAFALTPLSFSFPFSPTASLGFTRPSSFAPFAIPWRLFA